VFVGTGDYPLVADALRVTGVDQIPERAVVDRDGQVRARWGQTPVDLFFSYDPIHDAMRDAVRRVPFGEATIPILAPEHLLVAKAVFNRPKDWIDIEQMMIAADDLDAAEIRRWLVHLAGEDDPRFLRVERLIRELRTLD